MFEMPLRWRATDILGGELLIFYSILIVGIVFSKSIFKRHICFSDEEKSILYNFASFCTYYWISKVFIKTV